MLREKRERSGGITAIVGEVGIAEKGELLLNPSP